MHQCEGKIIYKKYFFKSLNDYKRIIYQATHLMVGARRIHNQPLDLSEEYQLIGIRVKRLKRNELVT